MGCDGDDRSEATVSDGGVTPAGAASCEQSAKPFCGKLFECYPQWGKQWYGTLESCLVAEAAGCRYAAGLPGVSPRSVQGWAACNRALGARTCDQWRFGSPIEECRLPAGSLAPGEGCSSYGQCATSYCRFQVDPTTGDASPCGVCAKAPEVGEDCSWPNGCGFGLKCIDRPDAPSGVACVQPAAEGSACGVELQDCQGELVCVEGRCSRPLRIGAACAASFQCQYDLRCVQGACGSPLVEGAACAPDDVVCDFGLGCLDGVCKPLLVEGEACTANEECLGEFCDGDLDVNGSVRNGHCLGGGPILRTGEACGPDVDGECDDNAFCDSATQRCVLRKPNGQRCTADDQCLDWLVCTGSKCDEPPAPMCGG
jgi:hypothetical protein